MNDTCEDCGRVWFEFGDRVRSVQNPHLTGQVINETNWGDQYCVRLADGATTIWWHWNELELDPEFSPPLPAEVGSDNVVSFENWAQMFGTGKVTRAGGLH